MKSIKKLIIASALSMMAASCYASVLPNTEQQKSVDVSFAAPEHLTISFDQVPGLVAGKARDGMDIAKLTVNSTSIKEFGVRAIASTLLDGAGSAWKTAGKNSGNPITVGFSNNNMGRTHGPMVWNGRTWITFDTNDPLDIVVMGDQNISPDTYPLTVDVVGYQP
ncbi:pilus assembly protein [Salmonella enterica]|nr:pilus assembly protein [Salmonella enterica subsp. enterica serovar Telelkebir]EBM1718559.1 pilus assembly protein [Salmonella enterica]EDV3145719.1 pilus assembly protein [Salmonella enterica subsp. enterica]EAB5406234.1 pilus assembly protein [Salmonella enterica subsp. enterica serovar Telelkebir]EBS3085490.1 pilus assembly protein [Salmonella enterica subsp. enterica serovar Telelkebir]